MSAERVVLLHELGPECRVMLVSSGPMDEFALEALELFIASRRRLLADLRASIPPPCSDCGAPMVQERTNTFVCSAACDGAAESEE